MTCIKKKKKLFLVYLLVGLGKLFKVEIFIKEKRKKKKKKRF